MTASRYAALALAAPNQSQHILGFGVGNPWPTEAGAKSWGGLDRVFGTPGNLASGFMKDARRRVLYVCGCPAWMRRPVSGAWNDPIPQGSLTDDFDYKPPHSSQYGKLASLAAATVTRYTQITHVIVWNEFKGFYRNDGANAWWYEGYTDMYNQIYAAVKAVNPAIQVGGPYMVFNTQGWQFSNDWADDAETDPLMRLQGHAPYHWGYADKKVLTSIRYWLNNATAADFFVCDLRNSTKDYAASDAENITYTAAVWDTNPEGGANPYYWPTDPWNSWQKEQDIMTWFRSLGAAFPTLYGRSGIDSRTLPFWWAEWYPNSLVNNATVDPNTGVNYPNPVSSDAEKNTVAAEGKKRAAWAGYGPVFQWRPQGDSNGHANPIGLWNSSGVATDLARIDGLFDTHFPSGTVLYTTTNVPSNISLMASATKVLVINKSATPTTFIIDNVQHTAAAWEVSVIVRP
jgi:hypothetical protein